MGPAAESTQLKCCGPTVASVAMGTWLREGGDAVIQGVIAGCCGAPSGLDHTEPPRGDSPVLIGCPREARW